MLFFLSWSISWIFQTPLLIPGQSLQLFSEVGLMFPGWSLPMPALVYAMQAFFVAHRVSPAVSGVGSLKFAQAWLYCYAQSSPLETCPLGWLWVQMKLSHISVFSLAPAVKSHSIQPFTLRFSRKEQLPVSALQPQRTEVKLSHGRTRQTNICLLLSKHYPRVPLPIFHPWSSQQAPPFSLDSYLKALSFG